MQSRNVRNQMYVASETLRVMEKTKVPPLDASDAAALSNYKKQIDHATKFIPDWVKVAVALALGLGTMVGWNSTSRTRKALPLSSLPWPPSSPPTASAFQSVPLTY